MKEVPAVRGLFVTATDTDVGKTWISCLIARQLRSGSTAVGVYKPACSGSGIDAVTGEPYWADLRALSAATGDRFPAERICPQQYHAALAPPAAAAKENTTVDAALLRSGVDWWREQPIDLLVVEGVGGLLCPLTPEDVVADLAVSLGFPLLVVARAALGTINHTLLTLEVARQRGLDVAGVILNEPTDTSREMEFVASNAQQIRSFGSVRRIAYCGPQATELVDPETRESLSWDWFSLGRCGE